MCLGVPNDFAQHALLLHLFCKETGYKEGKVIAMFGQVELYENHIDGAKEMIAREGVLLPQVETQNFTSIFDWSYQDTKFTNYHPAEKISFPIAV